MSRVTKAGVGPHCVILFCNGCGQVWPFDQSTARMGDWCWGCARRRPTPKWIDAWSDNVVASRAAIFWKDETERIDTGDALNGVDWWILDRMPAAPRRDLRPCSERPCDKAAVYASPRCFDHDVAYLLANGIHGEGAAVKRRRRRRRTQRSEAIYSPVVAALPAITRLIAHYVGDACPGGHLPLRQATAIERTASS